MPPLARLVVTEGAARGLERCRRFLVSVSPQAAKRAAQTIARHLQLLETAPDMGRPCGPADDPPEQLGLREWVIDFGDSGYVALYRHDPAEGVVYLLAFRHQKEAGY